MCSESVSEMSCANSSREKQTLAFPSLCLVKLYLMSQDINVVSHVPRRRRDILPVLSILKLHFSLQVSLLDHFHLERDTEQGEEAQGRGKLLRAADPRHCWGREWERSRDVQRELGGILHIQDGLNSAQPSSRAQQTEPRVSLQVTNARPPSLPLCHVLTPAPAQPRAQGQVSAALAALGDSCLCSHQSIH